MKLRTGDSVVIISGKDKGKKGSVLKAFTDTNRVIVSGVNMITKHVRKTAEQAGRIIKREAPVSISKVMILDPKTGKPTRIGYRIDPKTGKKERFAKGSGQVIGRGKVETPKARQTPAKDKEQAAQETSTGSGKSRFWNKVGFGKDAAAAGKAEAGPAQSSATRTRSAGRGS